jgi:phosphoribosylanthranilate isomerase
VTAVKICGLTSLDDALWVAEAGADLLGFVLIESSPRHVMPAQVGEIVAGLRRRGAQLPCVGVTAGGTLAELRALQAECGLDRLQLHGPDAVELAARLPDAILARQVLGPESLTGLAGCGAWAVLLDARGVERNGAAAPWDWRLLRQVDTPARVFVAGGLRPENVAEAVRQARPYGVDVASGVERAPGVKDRVALARFIRNVREVDDDLQSDQSVA